MKSNHIMMAATVAILVIGCCSLQGCGGKPRDPEPVVVTQEVDVPIYTMAAPPKELRRYPLAASEIPEFVAPTMPGVSSCLMPAGEDRLRGAIQADHGMLGKWEAWAF